MPCLALQCPSLACLEIPPGQGKAMQKSRQGKATQGKTRQGKVRQDKTRYGKQGKARQFRAKPCGPFLCTDLLYLAPPCFALP